MGAIRAWGRYWLCVFAAWVNLLRAWFTLCEIAVSPCRSAASGRVWGGRVPGEECKLVSKPGTQRKQPRECDFLGLRSAFGLLLKAGFGFESETGFEGDSPIFLRKIRTVPARNDDPVSWLSRPVRARCALLRPPDGVCSRHELRSAARVPWSRPSPHPPPSRFAVHASDPGRSGG